LLLDTHAFLWWVFADARLSARARAAIEDAGGGERTVVSAVVAFEIATKHALGKLPGAAAVARDVAGAVEAAGFGTLPVALGHAEAAGRLPFHHKDPFDRLLAAQALLGELTLVSADPAFDPYAVRRLW
jgi:PIN domain nuclease of toxin-antitoxin system